MQRCYRHPSRETGVSCSNCARPICPDCMTATSVGMRCPQCAGQRTKVRTIASGAAEPTLTYVLIAINVAVGLGIFLSGASATGGGLGGSSLMAEGWVSRATVADGQWYRIVTAGFIHAGFLHLAFNMFALYILGGLLEPAIGRLRFGIIYAVSLLGGSFGALLFEPVGPTVGASGAIFGLMAAALIVMRQRGIGLMESGLGLWLGLNLLITFTIPGVSIGGHLGGMAAGGLAALAIFFVGERARVPAAVPMVLAGAVGLAAAVGAVAVSAGPAG